MRLRPLVLLFAAAALAACGKDTAGPTTPAGKTPSTPAGDAHEDHGPRHGGYVLELGEHEGHLEVVHDASTGTVTAYVYDADMKSVATEAPVINLTKGGAQVTMTPLSGAGSTTDAWKAVNPALKGPLAGRMRVKIGDRIYQLELEAQSK